MVSGGSADPGLEQKRRFAGRAARPSLEEAPCSTHPHLHVCLGCRFHYRFIEHQCREDAAYPVGVKDHRNLCEYWKPCDATDASDEAAQAKAKPAALFGGPKAPST
jgi:hypothetical protein